MKVQDMTKAQLSDRSMGVMGAGLFGLGHFVANYATYSGTCGGTQHATAHHITRHATNGSAGGGTFFLCSHTCTATQAQSRQKHQGGEGGKLLCRFHEKVLQVYKGSNRADVV